MALIWEMLFASAFKRNASFGDNWVNPESCELLWPRGIKTNLILHRLALPQSRLFADAVLA